MSCPAYTPTELLNTVLLCAQNALATQVNGIPKQIIIGSEGAEDGFRCCDGGLLALTIGEFQRVDGPNASRTTSGSAHGCGSKYKIDLTLRVERCVATYKAGPSGTSISSSPTASERNAASIALLEESWSLLEQLRCCSTDEFRNCTGMNVTRGRIEGIEGTCVSYEILVELLLSTCCVRI